MRRPDTWGQFLDLCAPISRPVQRVPEGDEWRPLLSLLERSGFGALAYHNLKARDLVGQVPEPVIDLLRREHARAAARYHALGDLVVPHLEALAREIEFIVLKGTAWAHMAYPAPHLRQSGDIDLLLRPDGVAIAFGILRAAGWRTEGHAGQAGHGPKAWLDSPAGDRVYLELHDDIVPYREAWPAPSLECLWGTARGAPLWGHAFLVLSADAATLHAALKLVMGVPSDHHRYAVDLAHLVALGREPADGLLPLATECGARGVLWAGSRFADCPAVLHRPHASAAFGWLVLRALHARCLRRPHHGAVVTIASKLGSTALSDRPRMRWGRVTSFLRRRRGGVQ